MMIFNMFNKVAGLVVEPTSPTGRFLQKLDEHFNPAAYPRYNDLPTHTQVMEQMRREAAERNPHLFPNDGRVRNMDGSLDLYDPRNRTEFNERCRTAGSYCAASHSEWWAKYGYGR